MAALAKKARPQEDLDIPAMLRQEGLEKCAKCAHSGRPVRGDKLAFCDLEEASWIGYKRAKACNKLN